MYPHTDPAAIRLAVRRYATRLIDIGGSGNETAMNSGNSFHDQLDIVLDEVARRLLAGAEVIPAPGCIPHSRAAYSIGFIRLLVSTTQQLAADAPAAPMSENTLPGKIARQAFAAYDDAEYTEMADKGIVAIDQMLAVVEQAGKFEQWLTSFSDALTIVISAQGEQGNDQLVEHFVTLPMAVRTLQSVHTG